jgi:hypothetical protein
MAKDYLKKIRMVSTVEKMDSQTIQKIKLALHVRRQSLKISGFCVNLLPGGPFRERDRH